MFVTKRCDVTILRFRNSGIGRKKNVLQKIVVYPWGFQGLQNPPSLCVAAVLPHMAKVRFFPDPIGRDRSNAAHARTLAMHRPPVYLLDCIDSESVRMLKIGLST